MQREEQAKNVADLQQDKLDLEAKAGAPLVCLVLGVQIFIGAVGGGGVWLCSCMQTMQPLPLKQNTTKTPKNR